MNHPPPQHHAARQRLLITGASGFLGKNLVAALSAHYDVYACSRSPGTHLKRAQSVPCNICKPSQVKKLLQDINPAVIVHLASVNPSVKQAHDDAEYIQTNITGTFNLLSACQSIDSAPPFFIHLSSYEALASIPGGYKIDAATPYSATKAAASHLVSAWRATYGLKAANVFCSNIYGPFQSHDKLIPQIILRSLEEKPVYIYGNGHERRMWLYVADLCRGVASLVKKKQTGDFSLFGQDTLSIRELIRLTSTAMSEKRLPQALVRYRQASRGVRSLIFNPTKSPPPVPDWRPGTSFTDGIRTTIDWFCQTHPGAP